jgi:hypothetical protein
MTCEFNPHPSSALEYWFFKVNAGPIALIVDWIERRERNEHVLRASIHSPYKREVIFENLVGPMPADNFLSTQKSVGHAGEVSWDLDIDTGSEWIKPDIFPANLLKMPDTTIISAPLARFSGWIRHGSQQTSLTTVPGLLSQYWGRQLSLEWWWLSAHQFDREGVVVESVVARSTLWGTPIQLPLGYIYLHQEGKSELLMAPINPVRVEGSPEKFLIEMNRRGKEKITLIGSGREYGEFGDRIVNTLTGDLEIRVGGQVLACANGTAALERRLPAIFTSDQ